MEVDALNSSHPVSTPVEDPAQIQEMFDDVSYEKVNCVTIFPYTFVSVNIVHEACFELDIGGDTGFHSNEDRWHLCHYCKHTSFMTCMISAVSLMKLS